MKKILALFLAIILLSSPLWGQAEPAEPAGAEASGDEGEVVTMPEAGDSETATNGVAAPEMMESRPAPVYSPLGGCCFLGFILLFSLALVLLYCMIMQKAGYSFALGLLALIPIAGPVAVLCILAFGNWPIRQQLQQQKNP